VCRLVVLRIRGQRIRLALQFLHLEIEAPARGFRGIEHDLLLQRLAIDPRAKLFSDFSVSGRKRSANTMTAAHQRSSRFEAMNLTVAAERRRGPSLVWGLRESLVGSPLAALLACSLLPLVPAHSADDLETIQVTATRSAESTFFVPVLPCSKRHPARAS
jgi:hypothetical protein